MRQRNSCHLLARWIIGSTLLGSALAAQTPPEPSVTLTVTDLSPKFLALYDEAVKKQASPDERWELWRKMYHFAAVPPTPQGEKMARTLFEQAWPRYPSVLERIRDGAASVRSAADKQLKAVAALLRPEKPVHIELLVYVGGLSVLVLVAWKERRTTLDGSSSLTGLHTE